MGNGSNVVGSIIGVEGEDVLFDDKTTGRVRVPLRSIAKANLEIDTEAEFRLAEERAARKAAGDGNNTTE